MELATVSSAARSSAHAVWRQLRQMPLALALTALFIVLGFANGTFPHGASTQTLRQFGFIEELFIDQGQWWTPITALAVGANPEWHAGSLALMVVALGLAERIMGPVRALVAFIGAHLLALAAYTLLSEVGTLLADWWLSWLAFDQVTGTYAASTGAAAAATRFMPILWRRRVRGLLLFFSAIAVLFVGSGQSVFGFFGVLAGLVIGFAFKPTLHGFRVPRSSPREVRRFIALIVALFAIGPFLTGFAGDSQGPLSVVRSLFFAPLPSLRSLATQCGDSFDLTCLNEVQQSVHGESAIGSMLVNFVPIVLLLIAAEALRRGRRIGWVLAVVVQVTLLVLSVLYIVLLQQIPASVWAGADGWINSAVSQFLPLGLASLALVALLIWQRSRFRIRIARTARRRAWLVVAVTGLVTTTAFSIAWLTGTAHHDPERHLPALGLPFALARAFIPLPFPTPTGIGRLGDNWFTHSVLGYAGALFWLVTILVVARLALSTRYTERLEGPVDLQRTLLRFGGDSLSWMTTWDGNRHWINPQQSAGVSYQVHGSIAITVGGPYGVASARESAVTEFADYCAENALTPAFYSVDDSVYEVLRERGYQRIEVAQETLLDIEGLQFKGKEWQNVRTAVNKARKLGVRTVWGTFRSFEWPLRLQIEQLSEEWASTKSVPEMGFTLGGLDEMQDEHVLCCAALDADDRLIAVTSWLPVYDDGVIGSWTLDVMRRAPDGFNGAMEFMMAEAVEHFRSQVPTISMSGSPLATSTGGDAAQTSDAETNAPEASALDPLLRVLARVLEPLYGFQSLAAFKSRFKPRHRTLYLVYEDPLRLPAIGQAITSAYVPDLTMRQSLRMMREVAAGSR